MVRHRYFAHGSAQARIAHTGYFARARSWAYGEVIGYGCHRDGSAKLVFRRWMRSSGHRAAILTGRFRELGVGVARRDPVGRRRQVRDLHGRLRRQPLSRGPAGRLAAERNLRADMRP